MKRNLGRWRIGIDDVRVREIGYDSDGFYLMTAKGLRSRTAQRGTLADQRERFRYTLRNEWGIVGASALVDRLEMSAPDGGSIYDARVTDL